ncbi:YwqJ-related putative deaminase [Micromonospora sp. WMMD961]|uniref:YwqJ-related putative deaminase n=1 Tax=Micromonospora sp. WMMD961 TaxID=3016100 RepID=UPI0024171168|nr:YwqJ-related putative deaminase [Micromonospora sp. WMMD961]MDG4778146.1 YwqJ-related putative deaminase [Micromonospora sp. WMMD961]
MINPGEIPQIPGNMELLATHAQTIKTTGVDFANTGQAVDTTWQGLAAVYEAPEAAQLFAASGPIRTVSASVGEDVQAVGTALATYATEVKEIKAQLVALKGQAEQFVASTRDDDDWREDEGKVNQHNGLISAVNTQVAAFFEAQRKCANTINALYGGRQYRADNADGQADDGEYGFDANTLNAAAGEDGALPWGSTEEHDRGFLGDVGAFFGGVGEGFVTMLGDLGALIGRDPTTGEWSWDTAGQSWLGLGKFVWAVSIYINPVTIVIDQTVGMPFMEKGEAGNLLLNAGKSIIAYDMWSEDKSRAGGLAAFNIVSAVVGTKGAASGLRGAGAAVNSIRGSATAARISAGLVRAGNWLDNLPTVGEVAINFAKKFDIQIPQLGLVPAIADDVPTTRGFDVEMPSDRSPNTMNMDGGNNPGGNTPGGRTPGESTTGNLPDDNPPVRNLPEDTPPVRNPPDDTPPVREVPDDNTPSGNVPDDNTPGNVPDDNTPGNLPDDNTPGNLPDDNTPGNLPDDNTRLPDGTQRIPEDRTAPQELGRVEGDVTRDADGLITHVDGKPLDEYLRDTATQRTDEIRNMRDTGVISAKETGPVNSVAVDLRTGEVFEGVNGRPRDVIPDENLHPVLRERLEQMRADGPYPQYNRDGTPMMRDGEQVTTPYPHGDNPLRHAEVKAVNEMLWRRGPDVDASVMSEFRVDNRFPFRSDGQVAAPCCANCHRLLAGTPSNAGRLTYDSGHPDSQFIPE